jgi:hypothetical protein
LVVAGYGEEMRRKVSFGDLDVALCALGFVKTIRDESVVFEGNRVILVLPMYRSEEEVENRHLFYAERTLTNIGLSITLPKDSVVAIS